MALRLPTGVGDPRVQQCLDFLSRQFPIQSASIAAEAIGVSQLATAVKELFPQLPESANRKVLWGRVSGAGAKEGGSEGWTVSKVETGVYKVALSPALSLTATCVAVPAGTAGQNWTRIHSSSTTEVNVRMFNSGFGAEDRAFHFEIYG